MASEMPKGRVNCSAIDCKKQAIKKCPYCGLLFCEEHPSKDHMCYDAIRKEKEIEKRVKM